MKAPGLRRTVLTRLAKCALVLLAYPFIANAMTDASKAFSDPKVVELANAAQSGNLAAVTSLLKTGADPHVVGKHGMTVAHFALLAPRSVAPSIMKALLDAGADPVSVLVDGNTVPMIAVSRNDADPAMVRVLMDHGIGPNWRPPQDPYKDTALLHQAISGHNRPVVELLIKQGANIDYVDPFTGSALHAALGGTQFAVAAVLVDAGIDLSLQNNTSSEIKNPRVVRRTAFEYFCKFDGGKRGANPLPDVAAGWAQLEAALARRGTSMPCGL